jgi:CelD/BcsL family acetyltransferase involved in cellulose biosynthesis
MSIEYQIIETNSQFTELGENWNSLLNESGIASPFLTWEWMYCWWNSYGEKEPTNSLCIVLAKEEDKLIGILPGYIKKWKVFGQFVSTFLFLGSEYESSDYLDVIRKDKDDDLVENLFKFLISEKEVDQITLYNILEDQTILDAIDKLAKQIDAQTVVKQHRICPYLPLSGDWDSFVSGLSKNQRYNLRRRTRKLLEEFYAKLDILEDPGELEIAMDELFRLHEDRFKTKQDKSIFRADLRKNFHKKVSGYFLEKNILRLFRLFVNNKTIASLYCFEFANKLFYFQFGMDPEWAKYSPGVVIMGQSIKYAIDKELDLFDFMRGEEDYKFKWTDKIRTMVTVDLAITQKGKQMLGLREFGLGVKNSIKTIMPEKIWSTLKQLGK